MGSKYEVLGSKTKLWGSKAKQAKSPEGIGGLGVFGDFCIFSIKIPHFEAYLRLYFHKILFLYL